MSKRGGKKDTKHKEHINKYANKKQGSKKDWDNFARKQANYGLVNKARQVLPQDGLIVRLGSSVISFRRSTEHIRVVELGDWANNTSDCLIGELWVDFYVNLANC